MDVPDIVGMRVFADVFITKGAAEACKKDPAVCQAVLDSELLGVIEDIKKSFPESFRKLIVGEK